MSQAGPGPDDAGFDAAYRERIETDRENALADLQAFATTHPRSVAVWSLLAAAHHRRLDSATSLEACRALLALDPENTDGLHYLAFNLMALDDYEGALDAYQRTFKASLSYLSAGMVGVLLHRLGRLPEAAKVYGNLLGSLNLGDPQILPALRGAMNVLRDQGRVLAADRFAHMLTLRYRVDPVVVATMLADRDQTIAFHEWLRLVEKSGFAALLRPALRAEPGKARVPESFELPAERDAFLAYAGAQAPGTLFIVKPSRGSGGQGIGVVSDPAQAADRIDVVVQRYIDRPYLVDGRKGHLRIYALVTSPDPLRAYIYSEGIVRFAPEPYDPDPARLSEVSMHVTNTALHHGHPGLVISEDPAKEDEGSIWSLSAVLRRMQADGFDPDAVFGEIRDLIGWFLRQVEASGLFARQKAHGSPRAFPPKLLGFDVLLDEGGHPWLIEMQSNPAARGAPLVERINNEMFANVFRMSVGVLTDDGMSATDLQALRNDPAAVVRAERALETSHAGGFRPLWD